LCGEASGRFQPPFAFRLIPGPCRSLPHDARSSCKPTLSRPPGRSFSRAGSRGSKTRKEREKRHHPRYDREAEKEEQRRQASGKRERGSRAGGQRESGRDGGREEGGNSSGLPGSREGLRLASSRGAASGLADSTGERPSDRAATAASRPPTPSCLHRSYKRPRSTATAAVECSLSPPFAPACPLAMAPARTVTRPRLERMPTERHGHAEAASPLLSMISGMGEHQAEAPSAHSPQPPACRLGTPSGLEPPPPSPTSPRPEKSTWANSAGTR